MPDAQVTGSLQSFASVVDDAALQFEQAWEAADPAAPLDLESLLPDDSSARIRVALRLCQIDIERRTAAGQEPRAETYLERFPALAADSDDAFALILTEAEARLRHGRPIDPEATRRRFPEVADRLFARLLHRALPHVPGYEIEGELGRGAMGVVYKAKQVKLNRLVALKVVTAPDRQSITRFLLEAEAVAAVRHPNVIQVFDSGEYADLPYLAMEHLDGGTLQAALKREPVLSGNEAAELVAQLADGVQAVHEAGTVHRDLKPANVLFAVGSGQWTVDSKDQDKKTDSSLPTAHRPLHSHAEGGRLRAGDARRGRTDPDAGAVPGHAGLRGPGAGGREARVRRPAGRRVVAGRHPLRVPHRAAPVRRQRRAVRAEQGADADPGRAPRAEPVDPPRSGTDLPEVSGEEPGRPLPDRGRTGVRPDPVPRGAPGIGAPGFGAGAAGQDGAPQPGARGARARFPPGVRGHDRGVPAGVEERRRAG